MTQPQLSIPFTEPSQADRVLAMLRQGTVTTGQFCSTPGLAAEYRRAISDLRRRHYHIEATRIREGSWEYRLIKEAVCQ